MQAELEPGRGLGDLVLGETTLERFSGKYGRGSVSAVLGDEGGALELRLGHGQLAVLFSVDRQFAWDHGAELRASTRDLAGAIARHAEIRDARLTSVSVRAADTPGRTYYKSKLSAGVRLFDPIISAARMLGGSSSGRLPIVAGMSPRNPEGRIVDNDGGVVVYFKQPAGAEPIDPELVCRITVFLPDDGM